MLQNPVKRKLKEGKTVVGTWLNLAVNRRIREGWRFVGILGDLRFMTAAAKAARDAIKAE